MCSPASPFPLGRPVLATQLLVPSALLQHPGLAWCTVWWPGPRAPRSQGPHPLWCPCTQSCPCPLPVQHGLCQEHSGSSDEGDSTDTKLFFSIPTCIGFCLIQLLNAECWKTQHEILRSLLQNTGKVSRNSESIRNLLFCKYSEITCPECLHKLRYLLKADFITKSVWKDSDYTG